MCKERVKQEKRGEIKEKLLSLIDEEIMTNREWRLGEKYSQPGVLNEKTFNPCMKLSIPENVRERWEKVYGIYHHSGVAICTWTKRAIIAGEFCYKHKFYGIDTHRCAQISPVVAWCNKSCLHCWRPSEYMLKKEITEEVDDPEEIIENLVKIRKELLSGFAGRKEKRDDLFEEAYNLFPSHWAISLSGEPTLYPKLPELIKKLKERKEVKSIFLVTNGQCPDMLERLWKEDALPTQIYLSVQAPTKELMKIVDRPLYHDYWERFEKTLSILSEIPTRTVIRITLMKGYNTDEKLIPEFVKIIEKGKFDFVEPKSYMWVGDSRKRLLKENMLYHEEVKEWAMRLLEYLPEYHYEDEHIASRIVLLMWNKSEWPRWIIPPEKQAR